ncbi:thiol reductant ABC exporter subunit CydD [Acidisphaera sp. L21]|uniref:thiol reductant ABC exporter subunit CydD n=1 Tax=Acidisphaera sp. L21 TaxID=1641851 RepID=UPI00131A6B31|nr:thiol reductant ABC exporter subunit CydD [Acidisphaera sp. L21]
MSGQTQGGRDWLRAQTKLGRHAARPVVMFGLLNTILAIIQGTCIAAILGDALVIRAPAAAWAIAGFCIAALLRAGLSVASERVSVRNGSAARQRLRLDVMSRLLAAGPSLLRHEHSAALTTTVVDRVDAMDGFFARWLPASVLAIAGPVLVLLAVAAVDWRAALVLGACGLLVPVAQAASGIGAAAASRHQFQALSRLQARFLDRVRGISTIVLSGRAADEAVALAQAANELRRRTMRVLRVAFIASAALDCALALALVVLAIRYGHAAVTHRLNTVPALFVLLMVPEFFAPLRAFSVAYQDRAHATGAAEALATVPPMPVVAPVTAAIRTVTAHGVSITFEHVGFTWDPARGPALEDISFRVPAGETLVLAGPSGAGKSTILEILLGFVSPQTGRVLVNGADLATIVPEALNRMIASIGQRPTIFAGTVRDNIRFAKPDATDKEIEAAARNARVSQFVESLPRGLDTEIGEGGYGLSGGQAQRVAIARAFLKNAPLLLLDEPTAHLDPATEGDVMDSLRRLSVGRTVVMASHAAAVLSLGNRRLDLRDGRVVTARGAA